MAKVLCEEKGKHLKRNANIVIDANSLITPHLEYYPFDFAPSFWNQIEQNITEGKIAILDLIKSEVREGKDNLTKWIDSINIATYIDHRQPAILSKYSEVLHHIQGNPCYKASALHEWSKSKCADPWLIAAASVYNLTLVTFEINNQGLNPVYPSKGAKIPDVANVFGVKTVTLFQMMRELKMHLG
jgi:hypothetical protein